MRYIPRCTAEMGGDYGLLRPTAAAGTFIAFLFDVTIAIPISQERISLVLDTAD